MLRIQRNVGHLIDHLHPAQLVPGSVLQAGGQTDPVEAHVAGAARQQAHDDAGQSRFARARFADHRPRVAPAHFEAYVFDDSRLSRIIGADAVDGQNRDLGSAVRLDELVAGDALGHQAARVLLFRGLQDLSRISELDHLAALEHHDPIGDLRDDGEVVGDVERRRSVLADELAKGGEAFDLRRYVQGGRRLVEDQNVRLGDHRHRRHHALQLSAGDLMRITPADGVGTRKIKLLEQCHRGGARLRHTHDSVADRRLADLLHQRMRGIE